MNGEKVLVLRPKDRAGEIARMLREAGAEAISVPAIEILPPDDWAEIDRFIGKAKTYQWVAFTSVSGVDSVFGRSAALGRTIALSKVAAIGPATKKALEAHSVDVDFVPGEFTAEALGVELPGPPSRVALIRAEAADRRLDAALAERGFSVDRFDAYRTMSIGSAEIKQAMEQGVDVIVFTSASIVSSFVSATDGEVGEALIVCIGPATAAACRINGLKVAVEAREHTVAGVIEEMNGYLSHRVGPKETR